MKPQIPISTFFLPGAGGSAQFWQPLAQELRQKESTLFSWPGLGHEKHHEHIQNIDALVDLVEAQTHGPVNIVAQSMGGVVAVLLALRKPDLVKRMVLVATSAGVNMEQFGASDWRPQYRQAFPNAARWIENVSVDLTNEIKSLNIPTLLIWGDNDPISPVSVGKHLEQIFPDAILHIVCGGDHDVGATHAKSIAGLVRSHLNEE